MTTLIFPSSCNFYCLLITFVNSLAIDQFNEMLSLQTDPNCLTNGNPERFFEKFELKKMLSRKMYAKLPSMQIVKVISWDPKWAPVIGSFGHMTWILKALCHIIRVTVYTKENVHTVIHF